MRPMPSRPFGACPIFGGPLGCCGCCWSLRLLPLNAAQERPDMSAALIVANVTAPPAALLRLLLLLSLSLLLPTFAPAPGPFLSCWLILAKAALASVSRPAR